MASNYQEGGKFTPDATEVPVTIKDVKASFINKASLMLEDDLKTLSGLQACNLIPEQLSFHTGNRKLMVGILLDLIKVETDIQKIQAKNSADVLKAVAAGSMNIKDAKEMVSLLAMIDGKTGDTEVNNKIIIEIAKGEAV